MLCCDDKPFLVVENKIGARGTVDQLASYGQWLGRQVAGQDWPGALVFLTHFTVPPDGFATGDTDTYGVPLQYVCRWPAVSQWLNANVSSQPATAWQALAKELANFLEEREMTSEMMTQHDLAALEVYLPSAARVNQLFKHIWDSAINPGWPNELWGRTSTNVVRSPIHYHSDAAMIWDWGYIHPPNSPYNGDYNWFLAWGIGFPAQPGRSWDDAIPELPNRPYAFFGLFSERSNRPLPPDPQHGRWGLGDGWSLSASDNNCLIKGRAMCDFDPDPDRLAEQITDWVTEAGRQLKLAIPAVVSAVQSGANSGAFP